MSADNQTTSLAFVLCEHCGSEGVIYYSYRGGNDPDWTHAETCSVCHGTCYEEVETQPLTAEDVEELSRV